MSSIISLRVLDDGRIIIAPTAMVTLVTQNCHIGAFPPNGVMFMPKTQVVKVKDRKINASCVSLLTARLSSIPFLDYPSSLKPHGPGLLLGASFRVLWV
jgi:hypothetical protein